MGPPFGALFYDVSGKAAPFLILAVLLAVLLGKLHLYCLSEKSSNKKYHILCYTMRGDQAELSRAWRTRASPFNIGYKPKFTIGLVTQIMRTNNIIICFETLS